MKKLLLGLFVFLFSFLSLAEEFEFLNPGPHHLAANIPGAYEPGPNPNNPLGKEIIDLFATYPNVQAISEELLGYQKFRYIFGSSPYRGSYSKNSVGIFFLGQDGTHFAEGAGVPGVSGFGGRVQDLANYFGQQVRVATSNAFVSTIKGQYGAWAAPYVYKNKDGSLELKQGSFVDNDVWSLSHHPKSPVASWRNRMLDWVLKNNSESLKVIVTFGGAARDSMASYVNARGGKVGSRLSESYLDRVIVPEMALKYAGGNNQFPVPVTTNGKDAYADIMGVRSNDYKKADIQKQAFQQLSENLDTYLERIMFSGGGVNGSGLINPAQLGGYDLDKMEVNGVRTRNLKGLVLPGGHIVGDVVVIELPHPSYLSRPENIKKASSLVARNLKGLSKKDQAVIKSLEAEPGFKNQFAKGEAYRYGRGHFVSKQFPFGVSMQRMGVRAAASRKAKNIVTMGSRERSETPKTILAEMTKQKPNSYPSKEEIFTNPPRDEALRYSFDRGPGAVVANLMAQLLDTKKIFETKPGKSFKKNGIDAYYVRTHPDLDVFAQYRGDITRPKAVIFADPKGMDDYYSERALTGERGQYLHGMMQDLGYKDRYLVFKTVPVGMDGATESDWQRTLEVTQEYRNVFYNRILNTNPELIVLDGKYATKEFERIIGELTDIPVIRIQRGAKPSYGIAAAMKKYLGKTYYRAHKENIPRSHLDFKAKNWVGTTGDRVVTSEGLLKKGLIQDIVVPEWVYKQNPELSLEEAKSIAAIRMEQELLGVKPSGVSVKTYTKENPEINIQCIKAFKSK